MMTEKSSHRMYLILTSKTQAAVFMGRAAEHLKYEIHYDSPRDYNDRKAAQLFQAMYDLLIAEAYLDSWFADLGIKGCQEEGCEEESSIGGVPCLV